MDDSTSVLKDFVQLPLGEPEPLALAAEAVSQYIQGIHDSGAHGMAFALRCSQGSLLVCFSQG